MNPPRFAALPLLGGEGWGEGELPQNKLGWLFGRPPSPRPSPQGEGARSGGAGLFKLLAAFVALDPIEPFRLDERWLTVSLSQRERAGVRENAPIILKLASIIAS